MVRLKESQGVIEASEYENFNSTMVRLKVFYQPLHKNVLEISIPLWYD